MNNDNTLNIIAFYRAQWDLVALLDQVDLL